MKTARCLFCLVLAAALSASASAWAAPISPPLEYKQTMVKVIQETDVRGWPAEHPNDARYFENVVVSADGSKVGFTVKLNVFSDRHIFVMNGDGTGVVDLTGNLPAGVGVGTLQINDDGSRLFFWDYPNGNIYYFDTSPPYALHPGYKPDAFWVGSKRSYGLNATGTTIYLKHFWNVETLSHYGLCSTAVGSNTLAPIVDVLSLTPAKTGDYDLQFLDAARSGGRLLLTYYPDYWHDQRKVMWETNPLQPMPAEWHNSLWDNTGNLQGSHIMSQDGSKALYNFQNAGSLPELHLLDLGSGAKRLLVQLSNGNDLFLFPALSPDGTVARFTSNGYYATTVDTATGSLRDTFSTRFPEASSIGASNLTDITADNRYYYAGSDPGIAYIHRIDTAPAGTAPAPDITSITFGKAQLTYGDTTPVTVTVQVSDPKGAGNIQSVEMHSLIEGRESRAGQIYEPLSYQNPLTNGGAGTFTGVLYPNEWSDFYTSHAPPSTVGVRIVVRNKDEHYLLADTSLTVLPLQSIDPVTSPTGEAQQSIGGGVVPGSTVTVATDTSASDGPATVTGSTWSYTITGLAWGDNVVTVTARSAAGHTTVGTATITRKPKLSVTLSGDGAGTVTSDPAGVSCLTGTCFEYFPFGTPVALMATPNANSLFLGWSGSVSGTTRTTGCTMDANKEIGAAFGYVKPAMIQGTVQYYVSLQAACNEAASGQVVLAREFIFSEPLVFDQGKRVTIRGGYAANFADRSGRTRLSGRMNLRRGTLVSDRLEIR